MGWFRDVDPQQLSLCPRVTEVAGIVFPSNSLFQRLQITVYNDLGGPSRGITSAAFDISVGGRWGWGQIEPDETCNYFLTMGINWR